MADEPSPPKPILKTSRSVEFASTSHKVHPVPSSAKGDGPGGLEAENSTATSFLGTFDVGKRDRRAVQGAADDVSRHCCNPSRSYLPLLYLIRSYFPFASSFWLGKTQIRSKNLAGYVCPSSCHSSPHI